MTGATRRLVVVAVACTVLPSALHAQTAARKKAMSDRGWGPEYASAKEGAEGVSGWFDELVYGNDTDWDVQSDHCYQHLEDMRRFLDDAPMYWAEGGPGKDGETISLSDGNLVEWIVVFQRDSTRSNEEMLNLLLHEGWHWVHEETEEGTDASKAELCAWIPANEDDDDSGGGNTPRPQTCTETLVWVEPETIPVFVKPEPTDSGSGEPLPGCECVPTPVPGITIEVNSGYWTER